MRIAVCASWPQACITPHCWPFHSVAHRALEGDVDLLGDRQRVHVGAQRDDGPGLAALEHADHAGVRDLLAHLVEAERAQVRRRRCFAVRTSRLPSSGFWWKSRRQATTFGSTLSAAADDRGIEGERGVGSVHGADVLTGNGEYCLMDHLDPQAGLPVPQGQSRRGLHRLPQRDGIHVRGPSGGRDDGAVVRRRRLGAEPAFRGPGEAARRAPTSRSAPSCSSAAAATARSRPARRSSARASSTWSTCCTASRASSTRTTIATRASGWRVDGLPWEQY